MLSATLPIRPTWGDSEGAQVTGVGEITYHEGDVEAFGDGPDVLNLSVGAFDAFRTGQASAEFRLEYRWGRKLLFLGPMVGLMANADGGVFGYGALYFDFQVNHIVVTPSAGLGGYRKGGSKPLGGTFQFHAGLDLTYRFDDGSRLGIKLTHISNAHIHARNPSEESALLAYTLPIGDAF